MKYAIETTKVYYRVNLTNDIQIELVREDLSSNQASWKLVGINLQVLWQEDPIDVLPFVHEIGEYDCFAIEWIIDEKVKPFLKAYFADCFGPFVNEGVLEDPEEEEEDEGFRW